MVDPVGHKQARDAYLSRTEQAAGPRRAETDPIGGSRPAASPAPEHDESVQVSDGLRRIQQAVHLVKESPDARAERVNELQEQIASGEYAVAPEQVAAKMLGIPDGE